ncbi:unnamed protein product [Rhizoctonia solani]|uniref:Uncharacterized protein n=1 Tax=Rhizoctonia solani TaxID=456999 RepID=A0A8H2WYN8_9AGAM|nr:unnamed protein product [Rhizoctonia solani]
MDFTVMATVTRGTLPTRPTDRLKNDEQGNLVWELLLKCWSRDVSERPSAGQVVKTILALASCNLISTPLDLLNSRNVRPLRAFIFLALTIRPYFDTFLTEYLSLLPYAIDTPLFMLPFSAS